LNLDNLIAQLAKEFDWFFFYSKYCAGKNLENTFCRDFRWWAFGSAAVLALLLGAWIWSRLARAFRNWALERAQAKIADEETMRKHAWSGYTADAALASDQRAGKTRTGSTDAKTAGN
jgi:hypothetical protein